MAKFKVLKEAIAPYPPGDENWGKHYFPGDVIELDDDARTADWCELGVLEPVKKKPEEPERKKPGPKPKAKEGE